MTDTLAFASSEFDERSKFRLMELSVILCLPGFPGLLSAAELSRVGSVSTVILRPIAIQLSAEIAQRKELAEAIEIVYRVEEHYWQALSDQPQPLLVLEDHYYILRSDSDYLEWATGASPFYNVQ